VKNKTENVKCRVHIDLSHSLPILLLGSLGQAALGGILKTSGIHGGTQQLQIRIQCSSYCSIWKHTCWLLTQKQAPI